MLIDEKAFAHALALNAGENERGLRLVIGWYEDAKVPDQPVESPRGCDCTGCGERSLVRVALIGGIKICPKCIHLMMNIVENEAPEAVTWHSNQESAQPVGMSEGEICGGAVKKLTFGISPKGVCEKCGGEKMGTMGKLSETCRNVFEAPKRESIGRFGHHPNPAIDFCVEVDCLEGLARNACCGMDGFDEVCDRVFIAMMFRVGGDEGAVKAKQRLRELEKMLMENRPTTQIEGGSE